MKKYIFLILFISLAGCIQKQKSAVDKDNVTEEKIDYHEDALRLSRDLIIVDTHIDVPYRLNKKWEDISGQTPEGHFDYARAVRGGLNAPFMSIYIPASYQKTGEAKAYAEKMIDIVHKITREWPEKFQIAYSPEDIINQFQKGLISLPMGMENGAGIEQDLHNIQYFHEQGIRYITLTHSKWNQICDSSYDPDKHWNGLSPFGEKVVREMNKTGIMIDVSHISDSAFYQVIQLSVSPVIASHSACRVYTPGFERNMSDDMIKTLASHGGVIQVCFGSFFINPEFQTKMEPAYDYIERHQMSPEEQNTYLEKYKSDNHVPEVDLDEVVDHINHVAALVGVDHIGLGSDFDGVEDVPNRLSDVSMYPNLLERLLEDGYTEKDVKMICSGNIFRVWHAVDSIARNWNLIMAKY